ncbi:MAG: hypothetical protein ABSG67_19965 [Thermoguttaceae bacterium]
MKRTQYGLIGIFIGITAVAASFSLGKCLPLAGPWTFLWAWIILHVLHAALALAAFIYPPAFAKQRRVGTLAASTFITFMPLITLIFFIKVFVIGQSSNVVQIAGESGYALWELWAGTWPLLLIGNAIAWLVALVATVFPPYPPRYWTSASARFLSVLLVTFAWYTITTYFPDA